MMRRLIIFVFPKSQSTDSWNGARKKNPKGKANRHGAVLVLVAVFMIIALGLVAFAVDIGYILNARTELQRITDACALAAAAQLPDQQAGLAAAQAVASKNRGMMGAHLDVSNMEFGYWDRDTAAFTSPAPGLLDPNAVRVTLERSRAAGNPVSLFFGSVFGKTEADTSASATAMYDRWLCGPFVGIEWISVPGALQTDSYNSKEGDYSSANSRDWGSICSDGPIQIEGGALIRGDARAGKGYKPVITGKATVTRSVGSRLKPLHLPPVDASEAAFANDNHQIPLVQEGNSWMSPVDGKGNFLLEGTRTIELPPGTYYFNDFTVKGQSQFSVSGPTEIYVTGNLERSGGALVNNVTRKPVNLQFLMTGGQATVTSYANFHAVIYAPNTAVTVNGDSDLFGAVVGKNLTITGSARAHYDESLQLDEFEFPRRTTLVD